MASLEHLRIQGIRSYSQNSDFAQTITFDKPLTVIVGDNGCGKTSIIECLKFATTGEFPPNVQGRDFVHQASSLHVAGTGKKRTSVRKGEIRLLLTTAKGQPLTAVHTVSVTNDKTAKAAQQITYDGVTSTETKKAFVDRISVEMNVSKDVLSSVIFCHQEESTWPLADATTLKKKFDAIFDSTPHARAVDAIQKQSKRTEDRAKDARVGQATALAALQSATELRHDIEKAQARLREYGQRRDAISARLAAARESLETATRRQAAVAAARAEVEKLEYSLRTATSQLAASDADMVELAQYTAKTPEQLATLRDTLAGRLPALRDEAARRREDRSAAAARREDLVARTHAARADLRVGEERMRAVDRSREAVLSAARDAVRASGASPQSEPSVVSAAWAAKVERAVKDASEKKIAALSATAARSASAAQAATASAKEAFSARAKAAAKSSATADRLRRLQSSRRARTAAPPADSAAVSQRTLAAARARLAAAERGFAAAERAAAEGAAAGDVRAAETAREHARAALQAAEERAAAAAAAGDAGQRVEAERASLARATAERKRVEAEARSVLGRVLGDGWSPSTARSAAERKVEDAREAVEEAGAGLVEAQRRETESGAALRVAEEESRRAKAAKRALADDVLAVVQRACELVEGEMEKPDAVVKTFSDKVMSEEKKLQRTLAFPGFLVSCAQKIETTGQCTICRTRLDADAAGATAKRLRETSSQASAKSEQKAAEVTKLKQELAQAQAALPEFRLWADAQARLPALKQAVEERRREARDAASAAQTAAAQREEAETALRAAQEAMSVAERVDAAHRRETEAERAVKRAEEVASDEAADALGEPSQADLRAAVSRARAEADAAADAVMAAKEQEAGLRSAVERERAAVERERAAVREAQHAVQRAEEEVAAAKAADAEINEVTQAAEQAKAAEAEAERLAKTLDAKLAVLQAEAASDADALRETETTYSAALSALTRTRRELRDAEGAVGGAGAVEHLQKSCDAAEAEADAAEKAETEAREAVKAAVKKVEKAEGVLQNVDRVMERRTAVERVKEDRRRLQQAKERVAAAEAEGGELAGRVEACREAVTKSERESATVEGEASETKRSLREREMRLASLGDAETAYKKAVAEVSVTEMAAKDLRVFRTVLEEALKEFHDQRLDMINRLIQDLWRDTYCGEDIEGVAIRSVGSRSKTRSFDYKLMMRKDGEEMEMRGRCSAGQKVLACLIVRMALAEAFSAQCGIMTLDEPTTNLDDANKKGLATALSRLLAVRGQQRHFQLIIITHDRAFVDELASSSRENGADLTVSHLHKLSRRIDPTGREGIYTVIERENVYANEDG